MSLWSTRLHSCERKLRENPLKLESSSWELVACLVGLWPGCPESVCLRGMVGAPSEGELLDRVFDGFPPGVEGSDACIEHRDSSGARNTGRHL